MIASAMSKGPDDAQVLFAVVYLGLDVSEMYTTSRAATEMKDKTSVIPNCHFDLMVAMANRDTKLVPQIVLARGQNNEA